MRRELEQIEIPGEHDARERSWAVVRDAFASRDPQPRSTPFLRPLVAAAALAAVVAAALSPPGRAVVDSVRDAIGARDAEEALFAVPAPGRMLVVADSGLWTVDADGSKRLLGDYRDGAWSPFGRFVVAARPSELVALESNGDVRWKLARPNVKLPTWTGSATDTRIAYVTDSRLHVVGGDGRGDVDAGGGPAPANVRPAWRPGRRFELAYADAGGNVRVFSLEHGGVNATIPARDARRLVWSPDGRRLLVAGRNRVVAVEPRRGLTTARVERVPGVAEAAYSHDGRLAFVRRRGGRSELVVDGRLRFSGTGTFDDLTWSPDARWIVVGWREADQWLFVRASGPRRARAVANVARQFDSRTPPRVVGWCCS